jgi:hypothetical protein
MALLLALSSVALLVGCAGTPTDSSGSTTVTSMDPAVKAKLAELDSHVRYIPGTQIIDQIGTFMPTPAPLPPYAVGKPLQTQGL